MDEGPAVPAPPKKGRGGARKGSGQKPFKPTAAQRKTVRVCAAHGILQERICELIEHKGKPIALRTLQKHFRHEIKVAKTELMARVINALIENAVKNKFFPAQKFWLESQAGWKPANALGTNPGEPIKVIIEGGLPD